MTSRAVLDADPLINAHLAAALQDARAHTLALLRHIDGERLLGPQLDSVNPPLWELGHLGWFQEYWCLRRQPDGSFAASILPGADALYDSTRVAHAMRWNLPLLSLEKTTAYIADVLNRTLERLAHGDAIHYFAELALYHEDMHAEAFGYTWQTLGYPAPFGIRSAVSRADSPSRDIAVSGGEFMLGAMDDGSFVFDNEKWAHRVLVAPFKIARDAVSNRAFLQFVEDGGYRNERFWPAQAWHWRVAAGADHPIYWRLLDRTWLERRFDEWLPLDLDAPVMHVNWYEAQAYCIWAARRLPSEAEWEFAASTSPQAALKRKFPWGDCAPAAEQANLDGAHAGVIAASALPAGDSGWGVRQMIGNVWEWTADTFAAYPGFFADPYKEYSQPWFGDHKVLRGGCFATRSRLLRNSWRNFYLPHRNDVFAGFRTCALEE